MRAVALTFATSILSARAASSELTNEFAGVKIQSEGGKITLYKKDIGPADPNKVTVQLHHVRQVDGDGNEVCGDWAKSGTFSSATLATQSFEIGSETAISNGAKGKSIDLNTVLSAIPLNPTNDGHVSFKVSAFDEDGEYTYPGGSRQVKQGDMVWSIDLKEWAWCEAASPAGLEIGVKVTSASAHASTDGGYDVGGGIKMLMTNMYGLLQAGTFTPTPFAQGFPMQRTADKEYIFRFSQFDTQVSYSALMQTGFKKDPPKNGGFGQTLSLLTAFLFLCASLRN